MLQIDEDKLVKHRIEFMGDVPQDKWSDIGGFKAVDHRRRVILHPFHARGQTRLNPLQTLVNLSNCFYRASRRPRSCSQTCPDVFHLLAGDVPHRISLIDFEHPAQKSGRQAGKF